MRFGSEDRTGRRILSVRYPRVGAGAHCASISNRNRQSTDPSGRYRVVRRPKIQGQNKLSATPSPGVLRSGSADTRHWQLNKGRDVGLGPPPHHIKLNRTEVVLEPVITEFWGKGGT